MRRKKPGNPNARTRSRYTKKQIYKKRIKMFIDNEETFDAACDLILTAIPSLV